MTDPLERLRRRLGWLQALNRDRESLGEEPFEYGFPPPIGEGELSRLESRLGATLPDDYRRFLRAVGNGLEGPGCSLAPVEPWQPDEMEDLVPLDGAAAEPHQLEACVALLGAGCGETYFLVVRGARAGEVWFDQSQAGWPVRQVARSFSAWYEHRLDVSLGCALAFAARRQLVLAQPIAPELLSSVAPLVEADGTAARRRTPAPRSDEDLELAECIRSLAFLRLVEDRVAEAEELFAEGRARFWHFARTAWSAPIYVLLARGDVRGALEKTEELVAKAGVGSELDALRPLLARRLEGSAG